jgi:hypothetical protein
VYLHWLKPVAKIYPCSLVTVNALVLIYMAEVSVLLQWFFLRSPKHQLAGQALPVIFLANTPILRCYHQILISQYMESSFYFPIQYQTHNSEFINRIMNGRPCSNINTWEFLLKFYMTYMSYITVIDEIVLFYCILCCARPCPIPAGGSKHIGLVGIEGLSEGFSGVRGFLVGFRG